jgi:hypothetical protein
MGYGDAGNRRQVLRVRLRIAKSFSRRVVLRIPETRSAASSRRRRSAGREVKGRLRRVPGQVRRPRMRVSGRGTLELLAVEERQGRVFPGICGVVMVQGEGGRPIRITVGRDVRVLRAGRETMDGMRMDVAVVLEERGRARRWIWASMAWSVAGQVDNVVVETRRRPAGVAEPCCGDP